MQQPAAWSYSSPQGRMEQRDSSDHAACPVVNAANRDAPALHVLYLVHDLSDPANFRRLTMLRAGGADVSLAGFRRTPEPVRDVAGVKPIDLGRTHDGRFGQRLAALAKANLTAGARFARVPRPDVIIARNLEMLVLARRLNGVFSSDVPVVYECLDIHRLLLRRDGIGAGLRTAERLLGRKAALLLTSSPAFIREYFLPFGQCEAPILLLENKVLQLEAPAVPAKRQAPAQNEPWVIGWFGALRCRRSLELLSAFTRKMGGRFEVLLRGRPAYSEFSGFETTVAREPFIRFEGPYRNPDDLADIYTRAHFSWAIDFFEEGLNSAWLLPNRLYEGCRHGAVPIAMRGTETGRFLEERQIGLLLSRPSVAALSALLGGMDAQTYLALCKRVALQDMGTWVCGAEECRALVAELRRIAAAGHTASLEPAA